MEKKELRAAMRRKADTLAEDYVLQASEKIAQTIITHPCFVQAQNVFIYLSMPKEPGTDKILHSAFAQGKKVFVPRCYPKGVMKAVRVTPDSVYQPGKYDIPEPVNDTETISADELDLIIVPCLSVSKDGRRLGHGMGYYDRFFGISGVIKMCICFEEMICEDIPMEDTDIYVDYIVTEKEITHKKTL
ncbi:MAG: 5-formyltetrahydrofolate cyclo-ligase [Solobacterium sp.]|nr:5-formyltetrahydrofolate cyclo-ligase [Solobacterium sp.]